MSEIITIFEYAGIPYKHLGRDKNGVDCWGLIMLIYKDKLNIQLQDIGDIGEVDYAKNWSLQGKDYFMENYQSRWERVTTPKIFDIVLLRNSRGIANHAGVMLNSNSFINCLKGGVVVSRITDAVWKGRLVGFFRYKK